MKHVTILLALLAGLVAGCTAPTVGERPYVSTGIDPETWARVPAGEFLMGIHQHETPVDYDYEIMVTDVTNAQYAAYLNEALAAGTVRNENNRIVGYYPGDEFHGYRHEVAIGAGNWLHVPLDDAGLRLNFEGTSFTALPGYENHPMVLVTWFGAQAYCEHYGGRLPTEVEWEKAARGMDGRAYPWGDEIARNNANFYSSHDLFERVVGGMGDTTPVGFYNGQTYDDYQTLDSASPYGLYDMAGNVWQWMRDIYEGVHYRYMRGGSRASYEYNLRVWTRNNAGPDYYGSDVGFRCVRDATD